MRKKPATKKTKGRDALGRFSTGNQAAFGRRRQADLTPRITLAELLEQFRRDEFDRFVDSEMRRLGVT